MTLWERLFGSKEPAPAGPESPIRFTGLLDDNRPEAEKKKDYKIEETVAGVAAVDWPKKQWAEFRRFGMQNQNGSYSCVMQSLRKLMRVLFVVNRGIDLDFSATYAYRKRSNYPGEGSIGADAFAIAKAGVTLNAVMPSDNLTEAQMNAAKIEQYQQDIAENFKIPNYVQLPAGDLETAASVIQQTKKGVMVWFYFTSEEWGKQVPQILESNLNMSTAIRHSVVAVDYGMFNGEKGLFIEDSAHFGGKYERFVPEKFYKARNWYAAYPINFVFEQEPPSMTKPRYQKGNTKSLQDCLKYEGLFPLNVDSTGVYGPITTKAVKAFQERYGLEQVGTVGPLTDQKLKALYP